MTQKEIKKSLAEGKTVYWENGQYKVIEKPDGLYIKSSNGFITPLSEDYQESDFFMKSGKNDNKKPV